MEVFTLVVQVGRSRDDGLPAGATGAGLLCYAAARDEEEAVRETVAVLRVAGMAPLAIRIASGKAVARHPRIRVTGIEAELGTQLTIDTIQALKRRYPQVQFLWLMGSDNLMQFHRWAAWREIARQVPIVVMARPLYAGASQTAPAMGWLRRWRHKNPAGWRNWKLPGLALVNFGLDQRSATAIRRADPDWADAILPKQEPTD
mgnify:CR=1 FL=1